jgi:hypothetical protein
MDYCMVIYLDAPMANEKHVARLRQSVVSWNAWRKENPDIVPDLSRADLSRVDLSRADLSAVGRAAADRRAYLIVTHLGGGNLFPRADLSGADLSGADLTEANLSRVHFSRANLSWAHLNGANLYAADLRAANLSPADLGRANLGGANLNGANLNGANLQSATLVEADLTDADLTGCRIYGVSAWGLKLDGAKQQNLIITPRGEPNTITVDNIEVAQFIYLLLHNQKIRDVINTITSKTVLILGRFTDERKKVLDALRDELRKRNLLPILFDFPIPASRDVTETIKTLAGLARFVIADVTDATEVRVELHNIVRDFPSLPVQPILLRGHPKFVSQLHLEKFPWFFEYEDPRDLLASLDVVADAETKVSAVEEALKEARRKIEAEMIRPR